MSGECTIVFPGQGAQRTGMGADFCAEFPLARDTFAEASAAAGEDLLRICAERDPRLHRTEYTQPCVLTMEIAAYRVLAAEVGVRPVAFGGHSLGEYTALVAAGVLDFADGVRLVRTRGALMQRAVPEGTGAMAALILPDIAASGVSDLVAEAGAEVANDNSTDQLVISGGGDALEAARAVLAERLPDLRFVPLRVSAPFHSRWMRGIEAEFAGHLAECAPRIRADRAVAVTSNYTGEFHRPETVTEHLVRQISAPVRWTANMRALLRSGTPRYEVGPSAPLSKFFATLGAPVTRIATVRDLRALPSEARIIAAETLPVSTEPSHGTTITAADTLPASTPPPPAPEPVRPTETGGLTIHRKTAGTPSMRLFCWPFAGGKAAAYTPWRRELPDWVELCVIELPARQRHLAQTPIRRFTDLLDAALARVVPMTDMPFAFFGHSLGALTAYEVARRLPEEIVPRALFLGGAVAPHLPRPGRLSELPDHEFVAAVGHYGGIPPEVRETPEVMALFLPALRSDFEVFDDYRFTPAPAPSCPAHLFGGRDDRQVAATQLEAWRDVLPGLRSTELLPGGHFFLAEQRAALLGSLADKLAAVRPDAVSA
ncbi:acyltransferase domain-containing protein [Nocardia abscessus]|uniref:[acyl-carrier-protein] S-malonyltransferase n=1 Tax=Nocardia abscessus TaxID=120957 RepID=A0ABS0C9W6_9NOCA|nr:thioesterase domain-containing protein [Nocardia abscessus]MBF6227155.1 acyltransferase domain-containing protein [Nocardia abscessus]